MSSSNELHIAVEAKDIKKVKKLLSKPKKIKQQLCTFDHDGQTPLTTALRNNDAEMVDLLLQAYQQTKADINLKDKNLYTALHQSVATSDDKILLRLLQYDGIDVDPENDDKNRPLHYFCQKFKSPNCQDPFQIMVNIPLPFIIVYCAHNNFSANLLLCLVFVWLVPAPFVSVYCSVATGSLCTNLMLLD